VALGRTATSTRDDNFAKVCKELCTRALWRQISLYTDNPSCQNQHSFISLPPCVRRGRRFVLCNEPLCEISSNSQHHCYYNVLTLDHQILIHFMHTVVNWTIWYHMLVNCITYIYTVKQTIYIYISLLFQQRVSSDGYPGHLQHLMLSVGLERDATSGAGKSPPVEG
jgi:hypothetical protein